MDRLRPLPVTVFCALTLFTWVNRVWLEWRSTDSLGGKVLWSVPIVPFVVLAIIVLVLMLRGVDTASTSFVRLVRVFAAGTILFWAVRLPMILVHHHPVPFKVVHSVLALVAWTAAAMAWRSVPAVRESGSAPADPAPVTA